jgi:hypothetical protein
VLPVSIIVLFAAGCAMDGAYAPDQAEYDQVTSAASAPSSTQSVPGIKIKTSKATKDGKEKFQIRYKDGNGVNQNPVTIEVPIKKGTCATCKAEIIKDAITSHTSQIFRATQKVNSVTIIAVDNNKITGLKWTSKSGENDDRVSKVKVKIETSKSDKDKDKKKGGATGGGKGKTGTSDKKGSATSGGKKTLTSKLLRIPTLTTIPADKQPADIDEKPADTQVAFIKFTGTITGMSGTGAPSYVRAGVGRTVVTVFTDDADHTDLLTELLVEKLNQKGLNCTQTGPTSLFVELGAGTNPTVVFGNTDKGLAVSVNFEAL